MQLQQPSMSQTRQAGHLATPTLKYMYSVLYYTGTVIQLYILHTFTRIQLFTVLVHVFIGLRC